MDNEKDPGIRIDHIFLNKASFEHRPESASLPTKARAGDHQVTIFLNTSITPDGKKGMMTVRVQTIPENQGLYRFDVEVAALVSEDPEKPNMSVAEYLQNAPAALLYPFLREAVANLTGRGRFGQVMLHPVNFTRPPDRIVPREQLEKEEREKESPTS